MTSDGSSTYGYDANGNMTQRGAGQYIKYDAENRPVKVSTDLNGLVYVARMAYNGDGKRAKRVDALGTIHYVGPHYERNVGTGADTAEVITKFYHAQMGKMKRLIALRRGGTLYYVVPDHLGGTLRVADTSGNLVDDIRYHAFGATRSGGTNTPTDKRFTGQILDMSIELYWYGTRAYDPTVGRFLQADSIVPQPGNPQSLNRYSYTLNSPLRYTDPTGTQEEEEPYYFFVGGMFSGNDPQQHLDTWGSLIQQLGLKEGQYGFFNWSQGWSGPQALASSGRGLEAAAQELANQIEGNTNVNLVGHSRGGALVAEYLAQVAEARPSANKAIAGAYTVDAPLDSVITAQRRQWTLAPLPQLVDRYADLPKRLAERGLTVDVATFDNPADFPFTTHQRLPGVPRYEWAVGPPGGESMLPPQYQFAAHGLLLRDPRVATYLLGGYRQGGW